MSVKVESVEVIYCDICGKPTSQFAMKCWKCGKDCCDQHIHLVNIDHYFYTYVCDPDRDELKAKLKVIFDEYRADYFKRFPEKKKESS